METRSLAIDWNLDHPSIRQDGFYGRCSLSAFDAVFLDPNAVSYAWSRDVPPEGDGIRRTDPQRDRGFGRTLTAWMDRRRAEADDLLKVGGGLLVCRLRTRGEPLELTGGDAPRERVDRYSWLPSTSMVDRHHQLTFPANGRILARHGEDVAFEGTGNPFEEYLRRFEGHIVYDAVYQDLLSTPIERFATILARNRVGDVIAIEIPFDEGRLVLVPPIEGVPPAREAIALLEAIRQATVRSAFLSPPDWLPAYSLPGEDALADEQTALTERRDALDQKLDEVSGKLEEKTRHKPILYAKGRFTFVHAVSDAFQVLGFDVEDANRVLYLRSAEGNAIVVAEASEEAKIGLPAFHRLRDAVDRAITDDEEHYSGVLVVSGSRELDPKRRPTQFSAAALRGCQARGFCLLTSYQLFKLVQQAHVDRGKNALASIRRRLLECDGEFRESGAS
jgi:hypothetical protein